jgi:hypothetical protein
MTSRIYKIALYKSDKRKAVENVRWVMQGANIAIVCIATKARIVSDNESMKRAHNPFHDTNLNKFHKMRSHREEYRR